MLHNKHPAVCRPANNLSLRLTISLISIPLLANAYTKPQKILSITRNPDGMPVLNVIDGVGDNECRC
jgi:hypothetical protein